MAFRPAMLGQLVVLALLALTILETIAGPPNEEMRGGKKQRFTMRQLSTSNHNFTVALYRELSKQEGNVFFSPFSIHTVLSMSSLGAKGNTKQQFKIAMSLPEEDVVKSSYRALFKNLENTGNSSVVLRSANKIYTNKNFELNEKFQMAIANNFNSEAESVDFEFNAPAVRDEINSWVEEKTNNKIMDLIPENSLNSESGMVLVNAIYFKGAWATKFDAEFTKTKKFHINKDHKVDVSMMNVRGDFNYKEFENLDAKVLELNYAGDKLSMLIILPNQIDGLGDLEKKLFNEGSNELQNILQTNSQYGKSEVNVHLPKFKMEQSADLNPILEKLGMTDMFGGNSDFSGMLKSKNQLKVSKVAHKAFIEVNEEGAEAAAATMFYAQTLSITYDDEPADFNADHPFIFVLRHKPSFQAVFVGRVVVPQED